MVYSEVASRYAKALFELAGTGAEQEKVFGELRALRSVMQKDAGLKGYFSSPLVRASEKEEALKKAISGQGLSKVVEDFLLLLARKNRIALFDQIVEAFQQQCDEANGVTRGTVRSATVLSPEQRAQIEKIVAQATKKRVILSYAEAPELIGGLIAQVGSYTFDDTLTTHLKRLKEDLNRRVH